MNRLPTASEEARRVAEEGGVYLSPYMLGELVRTAGRVLDMLTKTSPSYAWCRMVLRIVDAMLVVGQDTQGISHEPKTPAQGERPGDDDNERT